MNPILSLLFLRVRILQAALLFLAGAAAALAGPVTVTETETDFTLSNGVLTARVLKSNGDLNSLLYKGVEMLNHRSGHAGAYWSHDTTGGADLITRVTIDPRTNGGARGEVSVKAISGGKLMGHGPGAAPGGDFPADIEIRYTLGRDDSAVYTYCTFTKQPEYPGATMTEARFAAKLADMFDWMRVDDKRDQHFPATLREGDKYIYTTVQYDNPAFGWTSSSERVGFWLLNPSVEFLSGGPTKVEFLAHRDTTQVAAPIVFNYWRSSHYGGAAVEVGEGERWEKTIGPFALYINEGGDHNALKADAMARQHKEAAQWPYAWVAGIDYPLGNQRATVTGRIVVNDPQARGAKTPNLLVGLTPADYTSPYVRPPAPNAPAGAPAPAPRQLGWQNDAKHYQFWARGDENGNFSVPHVRPGTYTVRAIADGVLGEYMKADVVVSAGGTVDLGGLTWTPMRRGRQVWDIGIPNRSASEFAEASSHNKPAISLEYPKLFPQDVNYVIGRSDFRRDWFFRHIPRNENPEARVEPFYGIRAAGQETPYTVTFDMAAAPQGKATLRLAICGTSTRTLAISINGQPAGQLENLPGDGTIPRHGSHGIWYEREFAFDASMLKGGTNTLTLTVPAGPINNGLMYDYLRLELDESARVSADGLTTGSAPLVLNNN